MESSPKRAVSGLMESTAAVDIISPADADDAVAVAAGGGGDNRAAQKLNISHRSKKKRHTDHHDIPPPFPTNFSEVIRYNPPPAPPGLLRAMGRLQNPGTGKVKVMLRVCPVLDSGHQFLSLDPFRKQVTVYDPTSSGYTTAAHRRGISSAPKMFAFDAVFSQDNSLAEICASSLPEIIQGVVSGADGCLFCYGHARLGKTYTMIGVDDSPQNMGVIPCAIAWLFKLINEQKEKTGARFSVRVSAVEVTGKQEMLKDLLSDVARGQEAGSGTAPGVYLREDPICGTQLENQSELRAPTADRATYYLDAAVAARTLPDAEEDARNSHLLFTLHVYQYRLDKSPAHRPGPGTTTGAGVNGGRSRLHLVDLGSCSKSKEGNALSLSALGNVILALLNGQRHTPHRDSKLMQLMRESLGNLSCRTCMIAHVSPNVIAYNETLQVIQLASKIHRMKRRRTKFSSTSSEESSCDESGRLRPRMRVGVRMGTLREDAMYNSSLSASSDPDYTSSEQSCDTVIYVGPNGQALSDHDFTDNENPPCEVPIMPRTAPCGQKSSSGSGSKSSSGEGSQPEDQLPLHHPKPNQPKCGSLMRSPAKKSGIAKPSNTTGVQSGQLLRKKSKVKGEHGDSEHWVDGPSQQAAQSEQWIDGPAAAPPQSQWDHGPIVPPPPEDYHPMYNTNVSPAKHRTERSPKKMACKPATCDIRNHETWVDGPMEFVVGSRPPCMDPRSNKMWTEMSSKPLPPPRGQSLKPWHKTETKPASKDTSPHRSKESSPHRTKHGETPKPSQHASHQLPERKQVSFETMSNPADPNSQPNSRPNSRPNSMYEGDISQLENHMPPGEYCSQTLPAVPIKSFVRDWVEKHSMVSCKSVGMVPQRTDPAGKPISAALTDILYGKHGIPDSDRIGSCHSSPRNRKRIRKSSVPPLDSSLSRVQAWVESVADTTTCQSHSEPPPTPAHKRLSHHEEDFTPDVYQDQPECDQVMIEDKPPPTYESCIQESILTVQTVTQSKHTDPRQAVEYDKAENEMSCKQKDRVIIGDDSLENELRDSASKLLDTSQETNDDESVSKTAGSIYEHEMDDQLETSKLDTSWKQTFTSEEGSTSSSLPRKVSECEMEGRDNDVSCQEAMSEADQHMQPLTVDAKVDVLPPPTQDNLSPPSSDDSDKPFGRKLLRPSCLRRPDGASNPNLSIDPTKPCDYELDKVIPSPEQQLRKPSFLPTRNPNHRSSGSGSSDASVKCSVIGHEVSLTLTNNQLPNRTSDTSNIAKTPSPTKSSVPTKVSSSKTSVLPKPSPKKSAKGSESPSKSAQKSPKSSQKSASLTSCISSPSKSSSASKNKDKNKKDLKSPTSSEVVSPKPKRSFFSRSPSKGPATPTKSKNQASPTKSTMSSSSSGKDSKSSGKSDKASLKASKSPSPSKKDSKLPVSKASNSRVTELSSQNSRATDSDSGNDSGIVKNDKNSKQKMLSPYAMLTNPRISTHSSSGHGSDASSNISAHPLKTSTPTKTNMAEVRANKAEVSSGYESMLRDSENTETSSSNQDSTSETSSAGRQRANKLLKKKANGSRRSRSAPARSLSDSPTGSRKESPSSAIRETLSPSPGAWVDTRYAELGEDEPIEIKTYEMADVERMQGRRKQEAELRAVEKRRYRVRELLARQEELKLELAEAKSRLMVDENTWSYDLYVAEQMDRDDPNYLEALEKETQILEKRVEACQSRIMMVTCFDSSQT